MDEITEPESESRDSNNPPKVFDNDMSTIIKKALKKFIRQWKCFIISIQINLHFQQQIPFLQYLTWSPQGDAYAYVYRCNIFYKPGIKSSKVYPITTDGTQKTEDGPIYNGIPDWVYEGTT